MNMACSATEGELAEPATISGIFLAVSAGTSTASKPTPMRATTSISREASSSLGPKRVAPSATALTGASLASSAWKSGLEIVLRKSTMTMSPRSFSSARPDGDIDCVSRIFFLLVAISLPKHA